MKIRKRIVSECSKNWPTRPGSSPDSISKIFEQIIQRNAERGFELESWKLSAVLIPYPTAVNLGALDYGLVETIIAIFVEVSNERTEKNPS